MKTNYYFSLLIVTSLLMYSCKDKEEVETTENSTDTPKEIIMPRVQPLPAATPNITSVPNQTVPAAPQAMPQPGVAAKGMNPAHGQPGHRCDIAVGAPLSSPKSAAPATSGAAKTPYTITQTPTSTTTSVPAPTTPALLNPDAKPTAPGMNPPHGQAGHKCEVAVGAPLPK